MIPMIEIRVTTFSAIFLTMGLSMDESNMMELFAAAAAVGLDTDEIVDDVDGP